MLVGVIDIGSNSIRLMLSEDNITLSKHLKSARLGEGLAFTGELKPERMALATTIIKEFVDMAKDEDANRIFIFATEAVRAAANKQVFLDMVKDATGIDIDVVPSSVEAILGFSGAYNGDKPEAIVDIGGASTEITVGDSKDIIYSMSLPIGCVRMRDKCMEDDDLLDEYISEMMDRYGDIPKVDKAVFVAGSASTVAMMKLGTDIYDVSVLDNLYMDMDDIDKLLSLLKATPIEERECIVGLSADRRDLMYGGMKLIKAILNKLNLTGFYFSDRDNLEGYLKYLVRHRGLVL